MANVFWFFLVLCSLSLGQRWEKAVVITKQKAISEEITFRFYRAVDQLSLSYQQALKLMSNPLTECVRAPTEM